MKRFIPILFTMLLVACSGPTKTVVNFEDLTFEEAIGRAQVENKLIMLNFFSKT